MTELFDRIVDKNLLIRRMYVVANRVLREADAPKKRDDAVQLDFFTDYAAEAWRGSGGFKTPRSPSKRNTEKTRFSRE